MIDSKRFRQTLGSFASGVTVVTGRAPDGSAAGLTVSAFSSLSLNPPMILVCLDKDSVSLAAFTEGDRFVVNVLAADQRHLSVRFSGPVEDRFSESVTIETDADLLIDGALASLECRRTAVHDGGDHVIVVGLVEAASHRPEGQPLIHFRGGYATLEDAN